MSTASLTGALLILAGDAGEWVWVFIDFNYDHGPYTISLDGGPEMLSSSYSPTQTKSQLVFGRAVEPGMHVLTMKNVVDQKVLGIDYFMYRPISNQTLNTSTTGPSAATPSAPLIAQEQSRSQAPSKELDVGWYVAIVLGVHVVALLVVGLWMFVRSRRRRTRPVLPVPAITVSTIPDPLLLHMQPAPAYMSRHEQKGRITVPVGRRPKMG